MERYVAITKGFEEELSHLLSSDPDLEHQVDHLAEEAAIEFGRRAARSVLAPFIWSAAIGDRWDVRRVAEFLRISRQAIYKRIRTGSLLGIPGEGTTWFPAWQFDAERGIVRPVVAGILEPFRQADEAIDPLVVAAWAMKPNRLLGGNSPAAWVVSNRDDDRVVGAARRVARGLAA